MFSSYAIEEMGSYATPIDNEEHFTFVMTPKVNAGLLILEGEGKTLAMLV